LNVRLSAPELKAVVNALGERDENAEICRNRDGEAEPDAELRDTENVPLKESIQAYFEREVLPHVPDAWIDHSKTKVGYEIPLNRHFYRYEPPRELAVIEAEIKALEADIVRLLGEVTAWALLPGGTGKGIPSQPRDLRRALPRSVPATGYAAHLGVMRTDDLGPPVALAA
jgi:hypothetical protein